MSKELDASNKKWAKKRDELQKDVKSAWKGLLIYVILILIVFGAFIYTNKDSKPIKHFSTLTVIKRLLSTDEAVYMNSLRHDYSSESSTFEDLYEEYWKSYVTRDVYDNKISKDLIKYQDLAYYAHKEIIIESYEETENKDYIISKVTVKIDNHKTIMLFKTKETNNLITDILIEDEGNIIYLLKK